MKVSKKLAVFCWALLSLSIFALNPAGALWGPSTISSEDSSNPQVKVDPDGNSVVTWLEYDGKSSNIRAKTFHVDDGWSAPKTITSFEGGSLNHEHKVAVDPAGNTVAIWQEEVDDLKAVIKGAILPFKAAKWMTPMTLSSGITSSKTPEISVGFSGDGMAAWVDEVDDIGVIRTASFIKGNWVLPAMDFMPSSNGSNPKMAVDSYGNTITVWEETIDDEIFIMGARLPFGKIKWISSNAPLAGPNARSPQLAINIDGDASAIWVNKFNIIQSSTIISGTDDWSSPPHDLSDKNFISSQPQIVIDFYGNITSIWNAKNPEGSFIQSAVRSFGGEWGLAVNVSGTNINVSDPQLAVDNSGNIVAAWRNIISDNNIVVQSSRLSEEGIWSKPVDLSKEGERAGVPQISTINTENAIVVWPNETLGIIEAIIVPSLDPRIAETQNSLQAQLPLVLPVVTGINPVCGLQAGGTVVTITGSGFTGVTGVDFGGVPATTFSFISDTSITATAPAGASVVHITVTNPDGTSATSNADLFTYVAPTITSLSATSGLPAGGNSVIITGTNFYGIIGASAVKFGGANATSYTVDSPTQITAVAPAGTVCTTVNVTVANCIGTSNPLTYTYLPAAPTVTALTPPSGTPSGGNSVVITGTNFSGVSGASAVKFGTNDATSYIVNSSTQITAVAPAASACQVNVTVTNCASLTSATGPANLYTYTLGAPPTITSLSVASGSPAGGTSVNIQGTNFSNVPGVTTVLFGSVPVAPGGYTVNSATSITATSPPATVCGTVDVRVTTCDGTSAISSADQFTYSAPIPTVMGVSPDFGPITGGTSVTITGSNFFNIPGNTTVLFGSTPAASFTVDSQTQITAVSPVGILSCDPVDITVTVCGGTSVITSADQFTFTAEPTVTALSVSSGTAAGGTTVVITGTNFFPSPGTSVLFDSTPAASITVNSSTQLTVTSPPGVLTCAPINVTVTTCHGTSLITPADEFTYTAGAVPANPAITGVTPSSGPQAGGTSVSISGTNLFSPTSVTFGGIPSPSFSANSAGTVVTAVSPAGLPSCSPVDIVVTNCQGSSTIVPADQFTYIKPLPTVTLVAPVSGPPAGGTSVVITGTNFYDQSQVSAVTFGGVPAASYIVNSPTQITAISPPGILTCAVVDIRVTTCNGGTSLSTIQDNFIYTTPPPTIDIINGVTPTSGTPAGGTLVTITGQNLYQVATVFFGNSPATVVTIDPNGMFIEALSPGGPVSCVPVEVTVKTCEGTSSPTMADFFTYAITPTVTGISPSTGPLAGGTSVTITGPNNFYDITGVFFGGVPATSFVVDNLGQITAVAPPKATCGPVDITVSNCGATSPLTLAAVYTYGATGVATVTSVSPTTGSPGGGTSVTILGTNFIGTTAVEFGGIAALSYVVNSNTQITAISPPGVPCSLVDVSVTNCGVAAINNAFQFSYTVPPTITGLSAVAGPCAGGTTLVITGTEFYDVTQVTFGFPGVPATIVSVTPTQITVITPPNVACDCTPIDVRVTTCAGTSAITLADKFIYTNFIGTVTGVTPNIGPPEGGTSVTITGGPFAPFPAPPPTVYFGSNLATGVVVDPSGTFLTAFSPPGIACSVVFITVLQCGSGTTNTGVSSSNTFTYVAGVPTVGSVTPNTGSLIGGTSVTIAGANFYSPATVLFGTNAATNVVVVNPTTITATSPAGLACDEVDVRVTTCGGNSPISAGDKFTYSTPDPIELTVTSISPSTGTPYGGTSVIITGTNFNGVTAVNFGSTVLPKCPTGSPICFTVNSNTQITAVSPPATDECAVNITVTACTTTSTPTPADLFTYAISGGAPIVQELTVASGLPTGGTSLIIIGKNFYDVVGATSVMFGAVPATSFTVNSPTSISVISPPGVFPPGVLCTEVHVTVTTCQGTSPTSPDDVFIYTAPPPTITTLSPMSGPLAGGNNVTITGTDFYEIPLTGAVLFGSIPSASYTVDSLTQITAVAPAGVLTCEPVYVTVENCEGITPNLNTNMYTYTVPAPTVSTILPSSGTPAGGTVVTITGTNFYNVPGKTSVTFGGIPASFTVDSLTQITAITPPGPLTCEPIDVVVTVCDAIVIPDAFEYTAPIPSITGVSPISGPLAGGNTVTITGTNFFTITGVSFGGIPATSFSTISSMEIEAVAPAGLPSCLPIHITVTNCKGTSATSAADQYQYNLVPPTVTKISPTFGPLAGGTTVTITGTNFYNIPPNVIVTFDGVPATSVTVVSPTQITAVSPAGTLTCDAIDVRVIICGVASPISNADRFIYTAPTPVVTSISPSIGSPLGGTSVTINGSNFFNVQSVHFGSNLATIVSTDPSGTSMVVTSPPGLLTCTGVHVTVTTCEGTSAATANDLFTYTAPPPSITPPLNPISGSPSGGTAVIITGTNFFNITSVKFGTVNATSFVVNSPTQITAFSPAGAACSTVQVTVTNCQGTSNSSSFLYLPLPPLVTSISPTSGATLGGNTVTITGSNFLGANQPGGQVLFGATPATSYTVVNDTTITAVAPAGPANCSVVDITVSTCAGTSTLVNAYTYRTTPTITSISPNTGPAGTVVTINGTNFTGTTDVTFGITPASFTFVSNTQLTAVVPDMGLTNCQSVDIRVTSCGLISANTAADNFSYQTTPVIPVTIASISPAFGPVGTLVTITGTGFSGTTGVTGVRFGAVNATSYTVVNDTTITAVAPNGTNCSTVSITVQNCVGTAILANAFQYRTPPTVTGVSPNNAPAGTLVTITGTNFTNLPPSSVTFGVTNAAPFTVVNSTTITVNVPVIAGATNCQVFDVRVTTCAGTSPINIPNGQFTYQTLGAPTVSSLNVNTGSPSGGTAVTITGNNFTGVSSVKFGAATATILTSTNTSIDVLSPAGTPCSSVVVTVTTCAGTSSSIAPIFTYNVGVLPPTVSSLTPAVGPPSGGTVVIITGTNFYASVTPPVTVTFDGIPATNIIIDSTTQIRATAPAGVACKAVNVIVTTCGGSASSTFTYNVSVPAPTVSGLTPAGGITAGGTSVSIQGNNFTGVTEVFFGGISVPFTFISNSLINATSPSGINCSIVDVTVTTCGGTSPITLADKFTYNQNPPVVTGISPAVGPAAGGTPVTITGNNFTGVTSVQFGLVPAAIVSSTNSTIDVISPAGASCSPVDVRVTTCAGTSAISPADVFTYSVGAPIPAVTSLTPAVGPTAGGIPVMITGTGFTGATVVDFGGTPVPFVINSDTSITVTSAPAGAACSIADIRVTTCGGTSPISAGDKFTYSAGVPVPTVASISPATGPVGTPVTITGTGFTADSIVKFGTTTAVIVTLNSTTITTTAPAASDCTVNVTVTNCSGTSIQVVPFLYTGLPLPHIISLNPSMGPSGGGNIVQIFGTGFIGNVSNVVVNFGGTSVIPLSVTPTLITVFAPGSLGQCNTLVRVVGCNGTSNAVPYFYVFPPSPLPNLLVAPTITSVTPNNGPVGGGNTVTIVGSNLNDISGVMFGSLSAAFTPIDSNSLTAIVPPSNDSSCVVNVVVVTCTQGTSNPLLYTYNYPLPVITNVSPNSGPPSGGSTITLTGTNFIGITAIHFGTVNAPFFTPTPTSISVQVPPGLDCIVDITVTGCAGTSLPTPTDRYTYLFPPPTITSVVPNVGPTAGGNQVVITGTNFAGISPSLPPSVTFGANPAAVVSFTQTQIIVTAPPGALGPVTITVTGCNGTAISTYLYQDAPFPPPDFIGCIKKNKFLNGTKCVLVATWTASPSANAVAYRIYKDNTIIAVIPATSPRVFEQTLPDCTATGYSITAINSLNEESPHVPLVLVQ